MPSKKPYIDENEELYIDKDIELATRPTQRAVFGTVFDILKIVWASLKTVEKDCRKEIKGAPQAPEDREEEPSLYLDDEMFNRRLLASIPDLPRHIYDVNDALEAEDVPLSDKSYKLVKKSVEIAGYVPNSSENKFFAGARKRHKFIKTEEKLSDQFEKDSKIALAELSERVKEGQDISPADLEKCRNIRTYNKAGSWVHLANKRVMQAVNPSNTIITSEFHQGDEHEVKKNSQNP